MASRFSRRRSAQRTLVSLSASVCAENSGCSGGGKLRQAAAAVVVDAAVGLTACEPRQEWEADDVISSPLLLFLLFSSSDAGSRQPGCRQALRRAFVVQLFSAAESSQVILMRVSAVDHTSAGCDRRFITRYASLTGARAFRVAGDYVFSDFPSRDPSREGELEGARRRHSRCTWTQAITRTRDGAAAQITGRGPEWRSSACLGQKGACACACLSWHACP